SGGDAGTVDLPAEIFEVQTNIPLIHQVVVAQLAAARQGTHATKTRGEVRGGGRKPYRQKGTGRARQGSTRAPQFAGGGAISGLSERPNFLVVLDRADEVGLKSLRNLPEVHVLFADQLNTYDVLCADDVVFTQAALDAYVSGVSKARQAQEESK